jgi:AcrR family transcriptional regulator
VAVGYAGLSMEAVAARAHVTKATLYLRYPSKAVLVFDTIFGETRTRPLPNSGDLRTDLREAYKWAVEEFAAPEARAALPGLIAEVSSSPQLARLFGGSIAAQEYARIHDLLERARRRGEVRADADVTLVIDAFIGTALARATILDHPVDEEFGTRLVDLLVDGLAPPPPRE